MEIIEYKDIKGVNEYIKDVCTKSFILDCFTKDILNEAINYNKEILTKLKWTDYNNISALGYLLEKEPTLKTTFVENIPRITGRIFEKDDEILTDYIAILGFQKGIRIVGDKELDQWFLNLLSLRIYTSDWERYFIDYIINTIRGNPHKIELSLEKDYTFEEIIIIIWISSQTDQLVQTYTLQSKFFDNFWTYGLLSEKGYFLEILALKVFSIIAKSRINIDFDNLKVIKGNYESSLIRISKLSGLISSSITLPLFAVSWVAGVYTLSYIAYFFPDLWNVINQIATVFGTTFLFVIGLFYKAYDPVKNYFKPVFEKVLKRLIDLK
jgi:hypothetical protein